MLPYSQDLSNNNDLVHLVAFLIAFLVFRFIYFKIVGDVYYFKDFSTRKSQSFFKSNLPPCYPNGWIAVACSSDIGKNSSEIHQSILCGNDIVLFRDENLEIVCLDAYCPHLGANLAYGGSLLKLNNKTCIKCPFHGWSFGKDGKCVNIPYDSCSKELPKASLKKYIAKELNGFIYVWYHADDDQPGWFPEMIEEIKENGKWKFMGRTEHIVSCHFQEIPENGADTSHLNAIHQEYDLKDQELNQTNLSNQNGHTCRIFLRKKTIFFSLNVFEMNIHIKQIGPAIVHLKFSANLFGVHVVDAVFIQSIQPLEPFRHRIIHHFHTDDGFFKRLLSKLFLYGEATMLERDIAVWSRKKFLKKPFLLKSESSIVKYRRWFLQFYSPNSPTVEMLRNTLEW